MRNPSEGASPIRLDLVPRDLLTPEDLVAFTGYSSPTQQKEVLRRNKIHFYTVRDLEIRTTWYHINNPLDLRCNCNGNDSSGRGSWQRTYANKTDEMPEPDEQPLEERLKAFAPITPDDIPEEVEEPDLRHEAFAENFDDSFDELEPEDEDDDNAPY